ncbi:helix-turn-helix domain-containing protein [Paenibacillus hamazuiensis]|uniref:helix-turn-helix domain-containing protein n=1 Tax=Paenibacillus hamazuiensis TaxID=2936508 RepID=UPI00200F5B1A|nr:helix-turn-helix domain-containing protein [Paenibacillus hamazuiensis]
MYSVILVDDEDEVREGIKRKINWDSCGFRLAGDYDNGRDALGAIDALRPDVVITDICMPFMDGLALAGQVAEHYRGVKTVIITGYEEFDYAKKAVKLKVNDFLLKPINAQEFTGLLEKIRRELDEERESKEDLSRLRQQLNQSLPLLRERFLERLAASRLKPEEIRRRLAYFGLELPGPHFKAIIFDADGWQHDGRGETDAELLMFAAFNIVQEIFEKENGGIAFRTRDDKIAVFLSGEATELEALSQKLAGHAVESVRKYIRLMLSAGIGRTYADVQAVSDSFQEACSALDYRFMLGKNKIILIDDVEYGPKIGSAGYHDWEKKLIAAMRTGKSSQVSQVLRDWFADLKTVAPIERCYGFLYKAVASLMNFVAETGFHDAEVFGHDPFSRIAKGKTLDEVQLWMEETCHRIIAYLSEQRSHVTLAQMRQAEAYIQEHYADELLSLQQVCGHIYMSASYFSAQFKQHTGETFVEYLTGIRMEKAKELLALTQLKAYEIAARVGYADPQYFSVIFKRHTGMTPKDYRNAAKADACL